MQPRRSKLGEADRRPARVSTLGFAVLRAGKEAGLYPGQPSSAPACQVTLGFSRGGRLTLPLRAGVAY